MATTVNSIALNGNLNLGSQIIQCAATMRQQVSRLNEINNQMLQMFATTPTPDYTLIEQQLGLAPGQGVTVWGIITNANSQIAGDAAVQKFLFWFIQQ